MSQGLERRINVYVGEGVRIARRLRRLTVKAVAEQTRLPVERLREIEEGSGEASGRELLVLSRTLGVDMNFFFDGLTTEGSVIGDGGIDVPTELEPQREVAPPRLLN